MSSPGNLAVTAAEAGNHNIATPTNTHAHSAHMLITALESVILPILHAHAPGLATQSSINGEDGALLEPEAQQLLSALEAFIDAHILEPPATDLVPIYEVGSSSLLDSKPTVSSTPHERPRLLNLALEEARQRIFNKMPIRLLSFQPDGSEIELLERSEIWERISISLEADFDKDEIKSSIDHLGQEGTAIEAFVSKHASYAILSHTWLSSKGGEVVYADWNRGIFDTGSPGYQKLVNFCRVAAIDHKITLGWMDTICINKESSTELDESIRSMYKWYSDADICITYLAQTAALEQMRTDAWFTRGWTLQELLAPSHLKFYGSDWRMIFPNPEDDRHQTSIGNEIEAATTITSAEFTSFQKASYRIPISRRMQWAANRRVTREEDMAYSLMGIFDISISTAYGEGSERAFFRLVKKILKSTKRAVLDVVNWGFGQEWRRSAHITHPSSLIPSSPRHYIWRTNRDVIWFPPTTPITLTHLGLHLSVLLMPAASTVPGTENLPFDAIGNYHATTSIIDAIHYSESTEVLNTPKKFNLLDKASKRSNSLGVGTPKSTAYQRTFGVLNFSEQDKNIFLPDGFICFALCLYSKSNSGNFERMPTSAAVSFPIRQVRSTSGHILKSELAKHGMQLVTMYL